MGKIGRNAPCPCGSGKKYKKCCLGKDEQKRFEQHTTSSVLPEPEPEDPLIDGWHETFRLLDDPDEQVDHLAAFMDEHPDRVEDLGLDENPLFEIGRNFFRLDRHGDYIALLSRIRREHPAVYARAFSFFDYDVIAYQLMSGTPENIPEYLNGFIDAPGKDPDSMFRVIDLLLGCNCPDIAVDFIRQIHDNALNDPNIIGTEDLSDGYIFSHYIPYLKPDVSDQEITRLSEELRGICQPGWNERFCAPETIRQLIEDIFRPPARWSRDQCTGKDELETRYMEITNAFMAFLNRKHDVSWMTANYYKWIIWFYLLETQKLLGKNDLFLFTREQIEKVACKFAQLMLWLESAKVFSMLNCLHYFANFLAETGTISTDHAAEIRTWCSELFDQTYAAQTRESFAARCFKTFPLFG